MRMLFNYGFLASYKDKSNCVYFGILVIFYNLSPVKQKIIGFLINYTIFLNN